jgi:acyl carrier protein
MTKEQFYRELEAILELNEGTIKGSEKLANLRNWDSMAFISLIAFADSKLGMRVPIGTMIKCDTVADVVSLFPGKIA